MKDQEKPEVVSASPAGPFRQAAKLIDEVIDTASLDEIRLVLRNLSTDLKQREPYSSAQPVAANPRKAGTAEFPMYPLDNEDNEPAANLPRCNWPFFIDDCTQKEACLKANRCLRSLPVKEVAKVVQRMVMNGTGAYFDLAVIQRELRPFFTQVSQPPRQTRFAEFDDADHPFNQWWQKHGQFMMSGGGRKQFIWACRGWIAHEQLAEGIEVTGDSLHETKPVSGNGTELELIELCKAKDAAYSERDNLVAALSKLFPAALERHPDSDTTWENDWRWIVFIDLPTGQATWHIHDSELTMFDHLPRFTGRTWDGHTTPQKYLRLASIPAPPSEANGPQEGK